MKIAIVLCGFPRLAEHVAGWSHQVFADYSVDFYTHFWYTNWPNMGTDQATAYNAIDSIKPIASTVDCYETAAWDFIDHVRQKPIEPRSEYYYSWPDVRIFNYNFPGQFISSSRAVNLVESNYDLIIKTRSDCILPIGANEWLQELVDLVNKNDCVYESGSTVVNEGIPFIGWDAAFYGNTSSTKNYFQPMEDNLKELFLEKRNFYDDWHYNVNQTRAKVHPGLAHVTWAKLALLSNTVIRSKPIFLPTPIVARQEFDYTWTWSEIEEHQYQTTGIQGFEIFNNINSADLINRAGKIRTA